MLAWEVGSEAKTASGYVIILMKINDFNRVLRAGYRAWGRCQKALGKIGLEKTVSSTKEPF
jgi:hypothetical protein